MDDGQEVLLLVCFFLLRIFVGNKHAYCILLGQWLNFQLFGITYLVGKIKFKPKPLGVDRGVLNVM